MGQKVYPTGFRLGITENWRSRWFAEKDYAKTLGNDLEIRKYLEKRLSRAAVSRVEIERAGDKVKVIILTARPGVVIGKKGAEIDTLRTELEKVGTTIMVQVKSNDTVEAMTTYLSDFSRNTLYRAKADAPGLRTGFRGREVALIELRSLCIPNEGTAYLLDLLSRMTNENSVSTNDNGVTQTVEARQGVALNAVVEIKPRVMLRPFRTFLEVEQPESEFLLRVDPDEGIGFFEADGGIWKLEAKKNIADYFLKNMGDLIDAGKVVVMQ